MENNHHLKKYINCYLFQNIETVTKEFMTLMKGYKICEISEYAGKGKDSFINYESQLLDFFNGILQEEPLRHTLEFMQHWRNFEIHSECNLHPVLPEDIIAYYSILKETLLHFIIPYATEFVNTEALINEINDLESEIQKLIAETFKTIQEESQL